MQIDLITILNTTVLALAAVSVSVVAFFTLVRPSLCGLVALPIRSSQQAGVTLRDRQARQLTATRRVVSPHALDWLLVRGSSRLIPKQETP